MDNKQPLLDGPMYFTGSDAAMILENPPDPEVQGPVDAAHFVIRAGRNPIHIWSYATREDRPTDPPTFESAGGGAPFDDTALGNLTIQVSLVLNEQRFAYLKRRFKTQTQIGNALFEYQKTGHWGQQSRAGYRLIEGHVGAVGEEIQLKNGIFPSIQLFFQDIESVGDVRDLDLENRTVGRATTYTITPIHLSFEKNGVRHQWSPQLDEHLDLPPFDQAIAGRREPTRTVRLTGDHFLDSVVEWAKRLPFESALIQADGPQSVYFKWEDGYVPISTSQFRSITSGIGMTDG